MQRFPLLDENQFNNLRSSRSIDLVNKNIEMTNPLYTFCSSQQLPKKDIPINNNRSRSCSGGRNKKRLPEPLPTRGI